MCDYIAQFYLQNKRGDVSCLTYENGKTRYSPDQIIAGQCGNLIGILFEHLFHFCKVKLATPFIKTEKTLQRTYFDKKSETQIVIYLYAGQTEPEPKITQSAYNPEIPQPDGRKTRAGWQCKLNEESKFFSQKQIFLFLLNRYLKDIPNEVHSQILTLSKTLRLAMIETYGARQIFGVLVDKNKLDKGTPKDCSTDKLICEMMNASFDVTPYLINKEKWVQRGTFEENDVTLLI